ncbi:MAG: hypothetical protein GXO48_07920 [Chlorobi bacterium]|nr:hypothetical protein [Chlorobiota bacterium]
MKVEPRLLEHPFYQAWTEGKVTEEQLSNYAYGYQQVIDKVPYWWQKVLAAAGMQEKYQWIVEEEKEHAQLWRQWRQTLPEPTDKKDMSEFIKWMDSLSPDELLGALHVFEIQQPEVAKTKKEGLIEFYGYNWEDLSLKYFDDHMKEEPHIKAGKELMKHFDMEMIEKGFKEGARRWFETLDAFMAEEAMC